MSLSISSIVTNYTASQTKKKEKKIPPLYIALGAISAVGMVLALFFSRKPHPSLSELNTQQTFDQGLQKADKIIKNTQDPLKIPSDDDSETLLLLEAYADIPQSKKQALEKLQILKNQCCDSLDFDSKTVLYRSLLKHDPNNGNLAKEVTLFFSNIFYDENSRKNFCEESSPSEFTLFFIAAIKNPLAKGDLEKIVFKEDFPIIPFILEHHFLPEDVEKIFCSLCDLEDPFPFFLHFFQIVEQNGKGTSLNLNTLKRIIQTFSKNETNSKQTNKKCLQELLNCLSRLIEKPPQDASTFTYI